MLWLPLDMALSGVVWSESACAFLCTDLLVSLVKSLGKASQRWRVLKESTTINANHMKLMLRKRTGATYLVS